MQRGKVLLGVLGLALAATTVHAAVPNTVKILGRDYTVITSKRVGTFKNGVTVEPQKPSEDQPVVPLKGNLAFAPGGTQDADRLFVVAAHQDNLGPTSDGFYMLQGTNELGVFGPEFSNAFVFFRGDREVHGRLQNITFLNDTDTGAGKDRNLVGYAFTGANMLRWYDLSDLMAATRTDESAFRKLTIFRIIEPFLGDATVEPDPPREELPDDENMPAGSWQPNTLTPNGTLLTIAQSGGDWVFGAIDPIKGTSFYPVKTALSATDAVDKIDVAQLPHAFKHLRGDEYLILASTGDPNWDETLITAGTLYHVRITLPADLTQAAADSIKIEVLGQQDILETGLGQSDSKHIFGLAVGRELNGANILYMADYAGNLFTLRPNAATAGQ
jgi:hypothetical protein